jgi:hypothetical protein
MNYRYPNHRIAEIVNAPKCVTGSGTVAPEKNGTHGARFEVPLDLIDGPFVDLRYLGKAGQLDNVISYDASLLLDQQRARGIGYSPLGRQNFRAKLRVPAGWHQNICDPNVATDDPNWNRHEALPGFSPTDFEDFTRRSAGLWKIDLGWEGGLL